MALSASKSLRLEDARLDALYVNEQPLWASMAQDAYDYALLGVQKTNEPIRQDDVVELLRPALELAQPLREFLSEHKLRQKLWYVLFAEYIIDREWPTLKP